MKFLSLSAFICAVVAASSVAQAQTAVVTATCKDGTTWSGAHKSGACSHHKGVKSFGPTQNALRPTPAPAGGDAPPPTPSSSTTSPHR